MSGDGSKTPEDQDWVDEILARAMERAEQTDPAPETRQPTGPTPVVEAPAYEAPAYETPMQPQPDVSAPASSSSFGGTPAQAETFSDAPLSADVPGGFELTEEPSVSTSPAAEGGLTDYGRPEFDAAPQDPLFAESGSDEPGGDWDDFEPSNPAQDPRGSDVPPGDGSAFLYEDDADQDDGSANLRGILEWGAVILGALTVALLIKTFLMQAYYIPSSSMESTLEIGDRILVNKVSYDLHDVNRGDLVVFERPPAQRTGEDDLIKRVIGLSGETIRIEDNQIFINNRLLDEPYLAEGQVTEPRFANTENCDETGDNFCTIKEGHVFVMGDNRIASADSRVFGPIDEDLIVGRAFLRVWPLGDIGAL